LVSFFFLGLNNFLEGTISETNLLSIPVAIVTLILKHLNLPALLNVSLVCKDLHTITKSDEISALKVNLTKSPAGIKYLKGKWKACYSATLDTSDLNVPSTSSLELHVMANDSYKSEMLQQRNWKNSLSIQEAERLIKSVFTFKVPPTSSKSMVTHACLHPSEMFFFANASQVCWRLYIVPGDKKNPSSFPEDSPPMSVPTFKVSQDISPDSTFNVVLLFQCKEFGKCSITLGIIERNCLDLLWILHPPNVCHPLEKTIATSLPESYVSSLALFAKEQLGSLASSSTLFTTNPLGLEEEYTTLTVRPKDVWKNFFFQVVIEALLITRPPNKSPAMVSFFFIDQQYIALLYRFSDKKTNKTQLALECWPLRVKNPSGIGTLLNDLNSFYSNNKSTFQDGPNKRKKIVLLSNFKVHNTLLPISDLLVFNNWLLSLVRGISDLDGKKNLPQLLPSDPTIPDILLWKGLLTLLSLPRVFTHFHQKPKSFPQSSRCFL